MALSVQPVQNANFINAPAVNPQINGPIVATPGSNGFARLDNFDQPAAPAPTYTYANGSTASSAAAAQGSADTAAQYQDQINQLNGQIGQLDPQQNIGLNNIANSYTSSLNRLGEDQTVNQRNYDTSTNQNTQAYSNNRNSVISKTNAQAQALQRLLGINGAGNSSASYEQAPYAAALQGTQDLTGAQTAFSNNKTSLDNNWADTVRKYKESQDDLSTQKYQQENALKSSIAQTRATLLDKIASANVNKSIAGGANYQTAAAQVGSTRDQINQLLSQITNLGSQYQNAVKPVTDFSYVTPTLNSFAFGNQAAPTSSANPGTSDVNPTFLSLLGQQRDQYGNLVG